MHQTFEMRPCLIIFICLFPLLCRSQSIDQIKADPKTFLWGEGKGTTVAKADREALSMLISQISVHVESEFTLLKKELVSNGKDENFSETYESVVQTYSSATLDNTERLVISNEPDAQVFRFIKRSEINKIFQERSDKIKGYTKNAIAASEKYQIADALRYYYWALTLLVSHPDGNEMKYMDKEGNIHLLATWIPLQLNNIFSQIDLNVINVNKRTDYVIYDLEILYNKHPVENFDYSYWNGSDWSNLYASRNGMGQIELFGMATESDNIKLKAEYIFEGESRSDPVTHNLLERLDPIPFRQSYYTLFLNTDASTGKFAPKKISENLPLTQVQNTLEYKQKIDSVLQAIIQRNYFNVEKHFTSEGYEIFQKLIAYGNARVIGEPELNYIIFNNKVICRSVPMMFNFTSNNKQFVENVVFHFNSDKRIESISFSLSESALKDILDKDVWGETDRLILVNFLEHYKTAYALKQLDYIESIFADDALIITGTFVKVKQDQENKYQNNELVRYNRQSKDQYIRNLRHSFQAKAYVNIKFENSKIKKAGKGGDIYGVQIKQNYFSSNYGDVGYLFLMVDLNNPNEPIIHVRTWQPETGKNDSIYGLSSFN